ncbi:MAG: TSCPD domain-containing protein [Desulfuromonadales bacterium]|nr:TSCPD domain-containing protein [Desulfuromonadales bacterium]
MSMKTTRPVTVPGFTIQRRSHCGKLFVTVTTQEEKPFEVFIRFGKAGGCGSAMADGLARLVSYGLRSGLEAEDAVKAMNGISCHLGPRTCLNEVASALRLVITHLETGEDINTLIEDEEFAAANSVEVMQAGNETSVITVERVCGLQAG